MRHVCRVSKLMIRLRFWEDRLQKHAYSSVPVSLEMDEIVPEFRGREAYRHDDRSPRENGSQKSSE